MASSTMRGRESVLLPIAQGMTSTLGVPHPEHATRVGRVLELHGDLPDRQVAPPPLGETVPHLGEGPAARAGEPPSSDPLQLDRDPPVIPPHGLDAMVLEPERISHQTGELHVPLSALPTFSRCKENRRGTSLHGFPIRSRTNSREEPEFVYPTRPSGAPWRWSSPRRRPRSFRSSPLILRYPHLGFSRPSRRISSLIEGSSGGRPGRREDRRFRLLNRSRCQRMRVSGQTRKLLHRSRESSWAAAARNARSALVKCGRLPPRRRIFSWWRSTAVSRSRSSTPQRTRSRRRLHRSRYRSDRSIGQV
jgi:hypothetical protein